MNVVAAVSAVGWALFALAIIGLITMVAIIAETSWQNERRNVRNKWLGFAACTACVFVGLFVAVGFSA